MKVTFDEVLVCDVRKTTFEDNTYYSLLLYSDGTLYRVSIPKEAVSTFKDCVGQKITLETDMSTFDGKSRFKLVQD